MLQRPDHAPYVLQRTEWFLRVLREVRKPLLLAYGAALAILAVAAFQPYVPFSELSRDTLILAYESEDCCGTHYGALSTFGILLWAASATIGALAAVVSNRRWLVLFSVLAALLCLDDAYLLHDLALPSVGLPQWSAYIMYALLGLCMLVMGRREMRPAEMLLLLAALVPLGISATADVFVTQGEAAFLFEDGMKLVGIMTWTMYIFITSLRLLRKAAL